MSVTPTEISPSPRTPGSDQHSQEFLHNSRELLNQIFKARMAEHGVSPQETISHLDALKSKALLANFFAAKAGSGHQGEGGGDPASPPPSTRQNEEDAGDLVDEVNNIWGKLRECALGLAVLSPEDATEVLLLLSSLINTDVQKSHEEIAESIFSTIDKDDLKTIDDDFLRYLTSHYAKLHAHDVVSGDEFDDSGKVEYDTHQTSLGLEDTAIAEKLRYGNDVKQILTKLKDWDFNVFELEELTPYPLVVIAETVLGELNLTWKLELNTVKLRRFLIAIQEGYLARPYHNMLHGTDITQTMFHMLTHCHMINAFGLNELAILAITLSASIHDVGHPGVTGRYLISIADPLAIQYNDNSPLENMHLATAFNIWLNSSNNFSERLPKAQFRELRRMIIEMVLFTDNDRHFALMDKLESLFSSGDINRIKPATSNVARKPIAELSIINDDSKIMRRTASDLNIGKVSPLAATTISQSPPTISHSPAETASKVPCLKRSTSSAVRPKSMAVSSAFDSTLVIANGSSASPVQPSIAPSPSPAPPSFTTEARQLLLMQVALHAADVSNPVKPWQLHMKWYPRLMEEFYYQGDLERDAGLPITFAFDRQNPVPLPKFQLGFLKAIVSPMYKSFAKVPGISIAHCLASLDANIRNWETLLASDEAGERIRTPRDVANETARWQLPSTGSYQAATAHPPAPPVPEGKSSAKILPPRPSLTGPSFSENAAVITNNKVAFK